MCSRTLRTHAVALLHVLVAGVVACGGHRPRAVTSSNATTAFAFSESAPAPPPISLTASDGTGLVIEQLAATARVHGPIAVTEVRVSFRNPTAATLEGRFRLALPPRSSMTRLAMMIDGHWREADAAELGAARETYEEILHRRRDPLLVEQRREREISARVFPILGASLKEIIVSYASEIGPDAPVTIPLRGLPVIGKLDVSIVDGATEPVGLHLENERPGVDVRFMPQTAEGVRAGDLVAVRVPVGALSEPEPITEPVVFLIETSASRAAELDGATALVTSLAAGFESSHTRVSVLAYDQSTARLYDGEIDGLARGLPAAIALRGALGASDLERGLLAAADEARRLHAKRVIIVGGGAPTTGTFEPKLLQEAARAMIPAGVERLDVLGTSALSDVRVYRPLTSGLFPHDGVFVEDAPAASLAMITHRITHRAMRVPVVVEGAAWSMPASFEAASPGEERVVLASLPVGAPVHVHAGAETITPRVVDAPRPVIEHAVAAAKLEELVARGERTGYPEPLRRDVVRLARQHHLSSPFTALIVLESDADVGLLRAAEGATESAASPPPPSPSPSPSAASHRHQIGRRIAKPPQIRTATTKVLGRLPPEVIQRVVRQNMGTFRGCYEEGLRRKPTLAGRVAVRFVIGQEGKVVAARDGGSEIDDVAVVSCVVNGFIGIGFPVPEGGVITVVYPLMLSPRPEGSAPRRDGDLDPPPAPQRIPVTNPAHRSHPFADAMKEEPIPPWSASYARVNELLARPPAALEAAYELRAQGGSATAFVALGQALEAVGDLDRAVRAYGSLADLFPERAEMLRAAAVRIDHVRAGDRTALSLLRHAAVDRPDQPSSHHLLGLALLRAGAPEAAFEAFAAGVSRPYALRYASANDLLRTDLGIAASAWKRATPSSAAAIESRAFALGAHVLDDDVVKMFAVATWETDTSDVDVAILAANGERVGSSLAYAQDGFGPEGLVVHDDPSRPLRATVKLVRRGSGGDVLGVLDIIKLDGRGGITFEPRPFTIMNEHAVLDVGAL